MDDCEDEDSFFQKFVRKPGEPIADWRIKDLNNMYEELIQLPFFMKELPRDLENYPELAAFQSMMYEDTPEEIATNFKNHGNEAYREIQKDPRKMQEALVWYTKGLEVEGISEQLKTTLLLNRAAVFISNEHYCNAVFDSLEALKLDPSNVKGYHRCGKALFLLNKKDSAIRYLNSGLELDPSNENLLQLKKLITESSSNRKVQYSLPSDVQQYLHRYKIKNIKQEEWVCSEVDLSSFLHNNSITTIKKEGGREYLSFPILFFYPFYKQTDFVGECRESLTLQDYIELVFSEKAAWDSEHLYVDYEEFEAFYECYHSSQPINTSIKKIPLTIPLSSLLTKSDFCLVDGICNVILIPPNCRSHLHHYTIQE